MLKRYLLYLLRWQLSTPILAVCVIFFAAFGDVWATVMANFIGGLLFFWVDRYIFNSADPLPLWSVKEDVACDGCGRNVSRAYRLVASSNYDRRNDPEPKYLCESCSTAKARIMKQKGIEV